LSEDEARKAVAAAIRLQAGRYDATPLYIPPSVTILLPTPPPAATATATASSSSDTDTDTDTADSDTDADTDTENDADLSPDHEHTAYTRGDVSAVSGPSMPQKVAPKNPKLRLTYWSLDTALSAIFKGPNPRLGRPSARTKVIYFISSFVNSKL
jgi:hypothetical protein